MSSATEGGGEKKAKPEKPSLFYTLCNLENRNFLSTSCVPFLIAVFKFINKSKLSHLGFQDFIRNSCYTISRLFFLSGKSLSLCCLQFSTYFFLCSPSSLSIAPFPSTSPPPEALTPFLNLSHHSTSLLPSLVLWANYPLLALA